MDTLYLIIALLIAMVLHEVSHGLVADSLGDSTAREQGRLTLNPLVHIDPLTTLALPLFLILIHSPILFAAAKPVPFKPWALRYGRWGAALVALGGPATNFAIALFVGAWMRLVPAAQNSKLLVSLVVVNVAVGVFNLIPFPPLDGSRVLYAAAPAGLRDVMDNIERMGFVAIGIFIFLIYPLFSGYVFTAMLALIHFLAPTASL